MEKGSEEAAARVGGRKVVLKEDIGRQRETER